MARLRERVYDALAFVVAFWVLLVAGTVAAVLFGLYISAIAALMVFFLAARWCLKKLP